MVITPVTHLFSAISCITGRGPPCTVKIEPFCTDLNVSPKRKDREITPLNLLVNQQSTCFRHQPSDHTVHPKFIYISKNQFGREWCDLQQTYIRHRHICTTSIFIYIPAPSKGWCAKTLRDCLVAPLTSIWHPLEGPGIYKAIQKHHRTIIISSCIQPVHLSIFTFHFVTHDTTDLFLRKKTVFTQWDDCKFTHKEFRFLGFRFLGF